jgi:hypothetical protein
MAAHGRRIAKNQSAKASMVNRELLVHGWARRSVIVTMLLVTVAVGSCVFDRDDGHHGTGHHAISVDLCGSLAIVSVAVAMALPGPFYALCVDPPDAVRAVAVHRIDPPPRSPSLS